jgi:hypothetical protein
VAIIFGLTLCGVVHLVDNIKKGDTIPQEFIGLRKKKPAGTTSNTVNEVTDAVSKKADAAQPGQMNFQTPATEIMEKIVDLHHDLVFFIVVIVVFVS